MDWSGGGGARRSVPLDLQVLIGIGGLLVLLTAAVGVAIVLIVDLRNDATRLTQSEVAYGTAIDAAALQAKAIANDERGFLLSGDQQFLTQSSDRIDRARVAFATATREASDTKQLRAVGEAQSGFERWLGALDEEIATFRAGRREAAQAASLGRTRALRKEYEAALLEAQTVAYTAIQSARNSVSESSSRSVWILVAYLGVALLIGVGLTLWLVRMVLRPVLSLARMVDQKPEPQGRL